MGSTQGTKGRSEPRPERGRFSSRRKAEAVLRLLHGEELDARSRELGVTAATLAQWRERFLAGGQASLKSRPADDRDDEIRRLQAKVARSRWTTSCCSSARISWRQDSLWHLGGRGDEPGQLALQRTPLRHGPRLPALGGPAFDGLRAAGASQPARAACGEARSERRRDGRRPHRADPRRARPLAVHRRGLPQGLDAAAPGRRAHLEGPGATADAGGGAARPDPASGAAVGLGTTTARSPPTAQTSCGEPTPPPASPPARATPRSSSPSTTARRSASASTRLAPARRGTAKPDRCSSVLR